MLFVQHSCCLRHWILRLLCQISLVISTPNKLLYQVSLNRPLKVHFPSYLHSDEFKQLRNPCMKKCFVECYQYHEFFLPGLHFCSDISCMSIIKLVKDSVFLLIPIRCDCVFRTKILSAEICLDKSRDWEKVIGTGRLNYNCTW